MLRHILPIIPDHKVYIEAFFGGGAVFWAKNPVKTEIINDVNMNVINFYEVLKHQYFDLRKLIESTLHSRDTYKRAMIIYDCPWLFPDQPVVRAWAFFVVTNQGFASKVGSWGYDKNNQAYRVQNKIDRFDELLSKRLKYVQIESNLAHKVITSRDTEQAFIYADPPYVGSNQGHYGGYTDEHFQRDLEALASLKGKFLLSSYPSELLDKFVNELGWTSKSITKNISARNAAKVTAPKKKEEILTANFEFEI